MIFKTRIQLLFPEGASFVKSPALLIYNRILNDIKRVSCMVTAQRCSDCPSQKFCRYYWLTGDNFQTYPAILCKTSLTDQKIFRPGDQTEITLYWIGEAKDYSVLIESALGSSNLILAGQPCFIRSVSTQALEAEEVIVNSLQISSPVKCSDPLLEIQTMSREYHDRYGLNISSPQTHSVFNPSLKMDAGLVTFPTRKLRLCGTPGILKFEEPVSIDSRWLEIGITKENCIGGGQLALDSEI